MIRTGMIVNIRVPLRRSKAIEFRFWPAILSERRLRITQTVRLNPSVLGQPGVADDYQSSDPAFGVQFAKREHRMKNIIFVIAAFLLLASAAIAQISPQIGRRPSFGSRSNTRLTTRPMLLRSRRSEASISSRLRSNTGKKVIGFFRSRLCPAP